MLPITRCALVFVVRYWISAVYCAVKLAVEVIFDGMPFWSASRASLLPIHRKIVVGFAFTANPA